MKTMKVVLNDDGSIAVDSTGVPGGEQMKELQELAASVGGDLKVEKHVHRAKAHHHGDGKEHVHE